MTLARNHLMNSLYHQHFCFATVFLQPAQGKHRDGTVFRQCYQCKNALRFQAFSGKEEVRGSRDS